jgi:uncharacterized protein
VRVLLAGSSGLLGQALGRASAAAGDELHQLVRRPARTEREIEWHPDAGDIDPALVDGFDAVVCLSGAGVGDHRWTPQYRETIRTSRVGPVGALARAIAAAANPPAVFVAASAIGYYGDAGARTLDESAPNGAGFLAEVCRDWEAAAQPAAAAGVRVVNLRSGIVLARHGPVLARMAPLVKLGLGGPLGSGRQFWSWITLADHVAATRFLMSTSSVSGPVNVTAPTPVTNSEFTRTLARLLHRPAVLPAPAFALKAVLGGFAGDILSSQRVAPGQLLAAGYEFRYPQLDDALRAELAA